MEKSDKELAIVFESPHHSECLEYRLVLESASIPSHVHREDGHWQLLVAARHHEVAALELDAYAKDNPAISTITESAVPIYGGAVLGIAFYSVILVSIFLVANAGNEPSPWHAVGRMRAGDLLSGQWWRAITALTLHVDAGHLMSNLVFGSFFGLLVGRLLGGGIAWFSITCAGAVGNVLNAMMQGTDHTSIGASTGVFAALGILVAHALRPSSKAALNSMQRYSPLIAGVLMLAFLGTEGERTDVGAHFAGFISGGLFGWFATQLPPRVLENARVQSAAGATAILIILFAWTMGVRAIETQ